MINVINILAQTGNPQDVVENLTVLDIGTTILSLFGTLIFVKWLSETHFGTQSLKHSIPRRNSMAFYMPLIPLLVWAVLGGALKLFLDKRLSNLPKEMQTYFELVASGIVAIAILSISFMIVERTFVRGFRGFGLQVKTIKRDLPQAFLILLAILPVLTIAVLLTLYIGRLYYGPDWTIQKHEGLEILTQYPDWTMRVILIVLTIVLAPIVEETLFRGLFQTMLRNYFKSPWASIIVTSLLFAYVHQIWAHLPALFILAVALGYAYEKSGSLLQSIFMHALFNGTSLIGTMLQQSTQS
jgi:membrane protease YdiL (CAAX protease family)